MLLDSQQQVLKPYGSHSQVVRKLFIFCSAPSFITLLTTAPLTPALDCVSPAHASPSYFSKIISNVIIPSCPRPPWRLFSSGFPTKSLYEFYLLSHAFNLACPSHSITYNTVTVHFLRQTDRRSKLRLGDKITIQHSLIQGYYSVSTGSCLSTFTAIPEEVSWTGWQ